MSINIKRKLLVLLVAVAMVFTTPGIGLCAPDVAQAESDNITVEVCFDASVVADNLSQLQKDMTDAGLIEESVTGLPEKLTVTVPKGATVQQVLQAAKEKQAFTMEGLDNGFVTQIGYISNANLENLVNTSVGSYTSGNVFASAGWSFYINDQPLSGGISSDKVTEDNSVVSGCYNLYGSWSSSESKMVFYDEPLLENYYSLKALTMQSVDEDSYTEEEISAFRSAKSEAEALLKELYDNANLSGDAVEILKEANSDFHTDGGMWIGYMESEQSAIWGPGSMTEKLLNAKTKLQKAIDKELVVKESEKADLVSLSLAKYSNDEELELSPAFDATTLQYSVPQLPNSEKGLEIKATSKAEGATITTYVNGTKKGTVVSGNSNWAMYYNALSTGDNKVEIVVTPPDGDTTKNKTYTVTVPRAKSSESLLSGISLVSGNYKNLQYAHNNKVDGTLFRLDGDGSETATTGFSASVFAYNTYVSKSVDSTKLKFTGKDANATISVKSEDGVATAYKSGTNGAAVPLKDGNNKFTITVTSEDASSSSEYQLNVIRDANTPELKSLEGEGLDADSFEGMSSLNLYYQNGEATRTAKVQTTEGAYVYLGSLSTANLLNDKEFVIDESKFNSYGMQTLTVYVSKSSEGKASEPYAKYTVNVNKMFSIEGNADEVVSYICPASQYTNRADYGVFINKTLTGTFKTGYWGACTSLGNFGGEVVYKFNTPIKNSSKHAYGIDFIVYGNSSGGASFSEPGNVYVSKDGKAWYSLAGSEHFEDSTITDYELTYYSDQNGANSKYTDNQGMDTPEAVSTTNRSFPEAGLYPKYSGLTDKLTVKGVLLQKGGNSLTKECAYGYADVHKNGTQIGTAVNPYVANHYTAVAGGDGMDLDWAVDKNGQPVALDEIQYVKVQTATLIDAGAFGEKSSEISGIFAAQDSEEAVGKTTSLTGVTLSDGSENIPVEFEENKAIYDVHVGDMTSFSIMPQGGASDDNVYINNCRLSYSDGFSAAKGFSVTKGKSKTVRVLVQNGSKEPRLYTLNLIGSGESPVEPEKPEALLKGLSVEVDGTVKKASKNSDGIYSLTVENSVKSIKITAETDADNTVKINNASVKERYELVVGKNTFDVEVSNGENAEATKLQITRKEAAAEEPVTPTTKPQQLLNLRVTAGSTSMRVSWNKISGADGYYIYGGRCGKTAKKLKTVKNATYWTQKHLKKANIYQYQVKAYKKTDHGVKILKTSVKAHVATSTNRKYTNAKRVNTSFLKATLKKGATKQIKATIIKQNTKKKLVSHASKLRYRTSNAKIASVSKNGKIKAVGSGTCNIYVYANNGTCKKLTILVK